MIKGSHHSEKAIERMSGIKKGKHYSFKTEFKKGHKINISRRYSDEWKIKVSKTWFKKGLPSKNKGVPIKEETKRKISAANKGKKPWNKGKKMSEEQRLKMIGTLKGIHRSPKTEFKKGHGLGEKNSAKKPDVREKISKAKKGKPLFNLRGEKHPRWIGKIALENERIRRRIEYKLWRKEVFARDNWTCQKCGKKGGKLNAHHIFNFANFSDLRISPNNGITFCSNCHKKFHNLFGIKNISAEKIKKFILS